MYAVIRTGGKQYRVEEGQTLDVERLRGAEEGAEIELRPLMVVADDEVRATPDQLAGATVKARVVGALRGAKITGFTYKNKSNQRRNWGHRQDLATIEITAIEPGGAPAAKKTAKKPAAKKTAKKPAAKKPAKTAKKPAAKKPAKTAKKPAAKKPAAKKPAKKPAKKAEQQKDDEGAAD